jgi:hypothetical protein
MTSSGEQAAIHIVLPSGSRHYPVELPTVHVGRDHTRWPAPAGVILRQARTFDKRLHHFIED